MNLASALLATATADPDRPALVGPAGTVTYGELSAAAAAAADGLDVRPGARVALLAGNEIGFVTGYLAALTVGALAVPCNPTAPPAELVRELDAVRASVLLATSRYVALARDVAAASESRPVVVEVGAATLDAPGRAEPVSRAPSDVAALLFTAGTAGDPKAAMLTHGSLLANIEQVQRHPGLAVRADDVVLGVLPFFHVYGLNVVLGLTLHAGARVALVEHFHPSGTLARVRADGVTVVAAVPAIYAAWAALDDATAPRDSFAGVRRLVSGAAALPPELVDDVRARFGVEIHDGYGLTEASPVVTTAAVGDARRGSIGPPLPGVEVRLVDADGADALAGDPGEVWVRGPNVFAGYWDAPDATARVLTPEGWLRTGDIAVADDDGWLALVDRAKDLVIVSGFNVFPGEVEQALREHPDVADVAVVGEPDPKTGEAVVAYVVRAPGSGLTTRDLLRHAADRLARYKLPSRVEFVDELPRNFAGKLLRRELGSDVATRKPA